MCHCCHPDREPLISSVILSPSLISRMRFWAFQMVVLLLLHPLKFCVHLFIFSYSPKSYGSLQQTH